MNPVDQRMALTRRVYSAIFVIGATLATTTGPAMSAFGLGLVAPGAGFLATGQPVMAGLFALSLVLWFATGNAELPPLIWGGSAVVSAVQTGAIWPAAPPMVTGLGALAFLALSIRPHPKPQPSARPFAAPRPTPPKHQLDATQALLLRLILDRALQPLPDFEGFEWIDQFQTAAVRYQITFASLALSAVQRTSLPGFQGYLTEAQLNLAQKQQDHRVWRYRALENLWGNLRCDTDPIPRDNIMFSGFLATQLALVNHATGRPDFDLPGSLQFLHPRMPAYIYDLPQVTAVLLRNLQRARFGLLPCEPNWIYPLCNLITATGLRAADPKGWHQVAPRFRTNLTSGFTDRQGRLIPFRSSLTGFAAPPVGGVVTQAFPCLFLNATFPELAARHWDQVHRQLAEDASLRRHIWPIDTGNYGLSRASNYAATAAAAAAMGDGPTAQHLLAALDHDCPLRDGHRKDASLWAHAVELLARSLAQGSFRDLAHHRAQQTPHLAKAPYPEILVTAARFENGVLTLTLDPQDPGASCPLELAGLLPGRHYTVAGPVSQTLTSDARVTCPYFQGHS